MAKNSEIEGNELILTVEDVDAQNIQPYKRGRKMSFSTNALTQNHISEDKKSIEKDETISIETLKSEIERKTEPDDINNKLFEPSVEKFSKICGWSIVYLIVIVCLSVLWSFSITIIPMTNQIENPEYWWEWILKGAGLSFALNQTVFAWMDIGLIFNFKPISVIASFIRILMIDLVAVSLFLVLCHIIWTMLLGYNHPMPMIGIALFCGIQPFHFTSIWFNFPRETKATTDGRKKVRAYILYRLWYIFYGQLQMIMNMVMENMPLRFQWIMAFIIPVVRVTNLWVMTNLLERTASKNSNLPPLIQRLTPNICISLTYGFWVAQIVSSAASTLTGYLLLGVDFFLNVYNTYKIIKTYSKINAIKEQDQWVSTISKKQWLAMKEEALMLAGSEIVEFLVPIIYCITLLMALFGSNAEKIGGLGFSEWQYSKLENLTGFLTDLGMMFAIDIAAWVTSAALLWKFTPINLLEESYKLMKIYWPLISTAIGGAISLVSIKNHSKSQ